MTVTPAAAAASMAADNYGAGRMAAQSALDGMEGALCVGLINYEVNGANGRDREQGARDAFAESGRAKITAAVSTHPNAASARADTLAMLRTHPEINVLIALNETTAVGAAQAVQQMQRADDLCHLFRRKRFFRIHASALPSATPSHAPSVSLT